MGTQKVSLHRSLPGPSMTLLKDLGIWIESLSLKPRPFPWLNSGCRKWSVCPPVWGFSMLFTEQPLVPGGSTAWRLVIGIQRFLHLPQYTLPGHELSRTFQKVNPLCRERD